MSLFIGSLAFEQSSDSPLFQDRLGIVIGSLISGVIGYFVIKNALNKEVESKPLVENDT